MARLERVLAAARYEVFSLLCGQPARELGISDRTFRRYVADLLVQLGASSRFQAGVRAVERGWI